MNNDVLTFPYDELEALHNCPKCGGHNLDMWVLCPKHDSDEQPTYVFCYDCGARTAYYPTPKLARLVWNSGAHWLIQDSNSELSSAFNKAADNSEGSYDDVIDAIEWQNKKITFKLFSLEAGVEVKEHNMGPDVITSGPIGDLEISEEEL